MILKILASIASILVILIFLSYWLYPGWVLTRSFDIDNKEAIYDLIEQKEKLEKGLEELLLMNGNTLLPISTLNYIQPQTLGMLILADNIIACESEGDPKVCNKEFGCRAGMGLWMFISGTWNETLDRMEKAGAYLPERCWEKVYLPVSEERTEAIFDAECNFLAGKWLLQKDGDRHWRAWSGKCYLNK